MNESNIKIELHLSSMLTRFLCILSPYQHILHNSILSHKLSNLFLTIASFLLNCTHRNLTHNCFFLWKVFKATTKKCPKKKAIEMCLHCTDFTVSKGTHIDESNVSKLHKWQWKWNENYRVSYSECVFRFIHIYHKHLNDFSEASTD